MQIVFGETVFSIVKIAKVNGFRPYFDGGVRLLDSDIAAVVPTIDGKQGFIVAKYTIFRPFHTDQIFRDHGKSCFSKCEGQKFLFLHERRPFCLKYDFDCFIHAKMFLNKVQSSSA